MARSAKPWYRKDRKAWFVTIGGVRHNLGSDKAEALRQFHALMREPKHKAVQSQTFVAVADAFLEWVKKDRAADTYEWYRYRIERFCQRYPQLKLADMKPFHVQQWADSYPNLSKTSRRNYLRSVKRCVGWACAQGYIEVNPIRSLEIPSAEHRDVCLTQSQFDEILRHIPDQNFRDLCEVTFQTGCRPQELLRVEARHVDIARSRWVFPVIESKGKRQPRIVYLSPYAEELTKRLVEQYPDGALFRNSRGKKWTTDAVNCGFSRIQQRMGKQAMLQQDVDRKAAIDERLLKSNDRRTVTELSAKERFKLSNQVMAQFAPRYSLYALRHSWATAALQSGLDGLAVGILLGHNDPSTLSRVYQHLSHNPEHLLKQARSTVRKRLPVQEPCSLTTDS